MKRYKMLNVGKGMFGYTIIEALIFLAVSGALLIATMGIINGRQEKVRFSQAVDTMQQNLLDIFNDVSTGYYPTTGGFSCSKNSSNNNITFGGSNKAQGTNEGCVFIGKAIELTNGSSNYNTYTMAGPRDATDITTADIKLLGKGTGLADEKGNTVDLKITSVKNTDGSNTTYNSLMIISDLGSSTGGIVSGNASRLTLYGYKTSLPVSSDTGLSNVNISPITKEVAICLQQTGNTSRNATLYISSQLSIERTIGGKDPVCT